LWAGLILMDAACARISVADRWAIEMQLGGREHSHAVKISRRT
jgi:hypothetical protein